MTTSALPDTVIFAKPSPDEVLVKLFPQVKPPPSILAPARVPNSGPEATAALLKALRDNHERNHVFFNDFSFHNHSAHHLLALYALGAPGAVIDAAYKDTHLDHMRMAFVAPENVKITDDNFTDYLGNSHYYNAYLDYFHRIVLERDATISSILEKYLFSSHYNVRTPQQGAEQPQLLNRFLEILIHPIIHVGYGAEFGIMGLIAEGLAWTSVHPAGATTLITRLLFTPSRITPITELENQEPKWMPVAGSRLRALTILSLMLRDPRFGSKVLDKHEYAAMLKSHGEVINKYGEMWDCDITNQKDLEARLEELAWAATLMYGVGSWDGLEAEYRADFFTAHIVTAALFLPSICAYLSHPSQTLLLRAYFLTSITWWLVRGRPAFALKAFTQQPLPPLAATPSSRYANAFSGAHPTPAKCTLPSQSSPYALTPNPWYPILAGALVHPNEHLCKVQRALAHWGALYGYRQAGFVLAELERDKAALSKLEKDKVDINAEYAHLDGSVFLRVAWLTGAALGWVQEGEENTGVWDYQEFQRAALDELELLKSQGRA